MQRLAVIAAVLSLLACGALLVQNRSLKQELDRLRGQELAAPSSAVKTDAWGSERAAGGTQLGAKSSPATSAAPPSLEGEPKESRLERRLRRQEQFAQLLGRLPGETDDEYRARVMPLANVWIDKARTRADEMRKAVEEKAQLSEAQRRQIDEAMAPAYEEFLAYTNAAITDGQLSPYDMNVTGVLEYAGGLGPLLAQTEGSINKVLSPEQQKIFATSGFEWGEYLWAYAPWDQVTPPPAP
ncbi:MAG: hypothetical protein IPL79_00510 [Myxococcales bacterium]|nr:hypothetical protein [Myxococcales bacterium]